MDNVIKAMGRPAARRTPSGLLSVRTRRGHSRLPAGARWSRCRRGRSGFPEIGNISSRRPPLRRNWKAGFWLQSQHGRPRGTPRPAEVVEKDAFDGSGESESKDYGQEVGNGDRDGDGTDLLTADDARQSQRREQCPPSLQYRAGEVDRSVARPAGRCCGR